MLSNGETTHFNKRHIFPKEHGDANTVYRAGYDTDGKYWTVYVGKDNGMNDWMHAWNVMDILGHVDLGESTSRAGEMKYAANKHTNSH